MRSLWAGGGSADLVLAAPSALGLSGALFVAGRIVFVTARLERRTHGS